MKNFVGIVTLGYSLAIIAGVIGWFLNLSHCVGYIGGGNVDDSTAEIVIRVVGIFTFLPGAIAGYF